MTAKSSAWFPLVCLVGILLTPQAAAQCSHARGFASSGLPNEFDIVKIDPTGAENTGNEIGRFWLSQNSLLLNNFDGRCPSQHEEYPWWKLKDAPNRGVQGQIATPWCIVSACADGDMTLVVEDYGALGVDAYFIAFRVDETPGPLRWWDFSRVDPRPSPSLLTMHAFPVPTVTGIHAIGAGDLSVDLVFPDIAGNVHAVSGPDDTPLPASSVVQSYDLYQSIGPDDPGRDADAWVLLDQRAYDDGSEETSVVVLCPQAGEVVHLALGLTFEGGAGPAVVSGLVGRAVSVTCGPLAEAGVDVTVECSGPGGTPVTLNAGGSQGAISYEWSAPGVVFDDPTAVHPTGEFPLGTTIVTLTVSAGGLSASDTVEVTVVDSMPPDIVCAANPIFVDDGDGEMSDMLQLEFGSLDSCCEVSTSGVVDVGWARIDVASGQVVDLDCGDSDDDDDDEGPDCGELRRCDEILKVEGAPAALVATSTDCSGNTSTCTVDFCSSRGGGNSSAVETEASTVPGGLREVDVDGDDQETRGSNGDGTGRESVPPTRRGSPRRPRP